MTPYQTVVFIDLDATLIINPFDRAVWPVILGEIAAQSGQTPEHILDLIAAENAARQADDRVPPVQAMDWDDISQVVASRLGVTLMASAEALVRQHTAQSSILDAGDAVLRELAAPHRALVVATKGLAKYQRPVLDALGLTPLFTSILTPDAHNGLKKHRAFFGEWPERARLAVMVGDLYDDDVLYPGGHGFRTVWKQPGLSSALAAKDPFSRALLYPYSAEQPTSADAIITHLSELPAVIRRLEMSVLGFSD